jgi:predicted transcriptional regulator
MNTSSDQQSLDEVEELSALKDAVDLGLGEIERGEGIPGPLAVEQARAEFRRWVAKKQEELRREIQKGIDDLDNGGHSPADEVFARLRARRGR